MANFHEIGNYTIDLGDVDYLSIDENPNPELPFSVVIIRKNKKSSINVFFKTEQEARDDYKKLQDALNDLNSFHV